MMKQIPLLIMLLSLDTVASPLSDGALRLIQIGNEIGSRDVVLRGQSLLLKGAFDLNDFDAMYEASKNLKFEQAGRYRDQLHLLKVQLMSR
jgi:hypothetical protein